jgi:hypothetical protein
MALQMLRIGIDLLILEKLQFTHPDAFDASVFELLVDIQVIALVVLLQSGKEEDEILEVIRRRLFRELHVSDPSLFHRLDEAPQDGVPVSAQLDSDIVEKEIVPDDLDGKLVIRTEDRLDDGKAFLGEAIDIDVLPVIHRGPLEQAMESQDKFRPEPGRKVGMI